MTKIIIPKVDKLNYGCGSEYLEGWFNVDYTKAVKTDYCGDMYSMRYIPEFSNRFSYVLLKYVFEHGNNHMSFMKGLYNICKPDAIVEIICPYYSSVDAWSDPDHKRAISENIFFHFDRSSYLWYPNNPITPATRNRYLPNFDFEMKHINFIMNPGFDNLNPQETEYVRKHLMNTVNYIHVILKVIKPGRTERIERK